MPNHVINEVTLHGVALERARPLMLNSEGKLSFAVLLPLPLNFWPSSCSSAHDEAFPGTWLSAARTTWGTKWDAYGDPTAEEVDGSTVLTFQSAWNHPRGWVCALFNSLRCEITSKWLSEGGFPATVERYRPDASAMGDEWKTETLTEENPEHRRLHKLLWGVEQFTDEAAE